MCVGGQSGVVVEGVGLGVEQGRSEGQGLGAGAEDANRDMAGMSTLNRGHGCESFQVTCRLSVDLLGYFLVGKSEVGRLEGVGELGGQVELEEEPA